jgi:hypothetical protein
MKENNYQVSTPKPTEKAPAKAKKSNPKIQKKPNDEPEIETKKRRPSIEIKDSPTPEGQLNDVQLA